MGWDKLVNEIARRGWTLTIKPAHFFVGISGQVVELSEFDPDEPPPILEEIVRCDGNEAGRYQKLLDAAIRLCRELDPEFGK